MEKQWRNTDELSRTVVHMSIPALDRVYQHPLKVSQNVRAAKNPTKHFEVHTIIKHAEGYEIKIFEFAHGR